VKRPIHILVHDLRLAFGKKASGVYSMQTESHTFVIPKCIRLLQQRRTLSIMLFFLLLMLFRSICQQVSHKADKFELLAIIFVFLPTFRPPIQVGFLRAMFLTTCNM